MATGFHLEPGYAWSSRQKCSFDDIVKVIKSISMPDFRRKCLEYGVPEAVVDNYIGKYSKIPSDDATISIESNCIMQLASGGGSSRDVKEQVRKALAILVLDECYRRGWSVSFAIV